MRLYEGLFVFRPEATSEARKNEEKAIEEVIQKFEGKVVQKTEGGKRPLGYKIQKFSEGYFLLFDFQLLPAHIDGFRKALRLNRDILHFMITVKKEKITQNAEAVATPAA